MQISTPKILARSLRKAWKFGTLVSLHSWSLIKSLEARNASHLFCNFHHKTTSLHAGEIGHITLRQQSSFLCNHDIFLKLTFSLSLSLLICFGRGKFDTDLYNYFIHLYIKIMQINILEIVYFKYITHSNSFYFRSR